MNSNDKEQNLEMKEDSPVDVLTRVLDSEGKLTKPEQVVIMDELVNMDLGSGLASSVMLDSISNENINNK